MRSMGAMTCIVTAGRLAISAERRIAGHLDIGHQRPDLQMITQVYIAQLPGQAGDQTGFVPETVVIDPFLGKLPVETGFRRQDLCPECAPARSSTWRGPG